METRSETSFFLSDLFGFLSSAMWPGLILFIVLRFRPELYLLFKKIQESIEDQIVSKVTVGGASAEFSPREKGEKILKIDEELKPVQEELDKASEKITENSGLSEEERRHLNNQIIKLSTHVGALEIQKTALQEALFAAQIQNVKNSSPVDIYLSEQQSIYNAPENKPNSRKQILNKIVNTLGPDNVINWNDSKIKMEFENLVKQIPEADRLSIKSGTDNKIAKLGLNYTSLSSLKSIELIDDHDNLTLLGISIFKSVARELKNETWR